MLAHQMLPRHDTRRNTAGGDNNGNGVPPYIQQVIEGQAQLIQMYSEPEQQQSAATATCGYAYQVLEVESSEVLQFP